MPECECSAEYGPCEQHAAILVIRDGAAARTGDESALQLIEDLQDCGVKLSPDDFAEYKRLGNALITDSTSGLGDFAEPEPYDSEAATELAQRVEMSAEGLWITHNDGYVIARPYPNCPLLEA